MAAKVDVPKGSKGSPKDDAASSIWQEWRSLSFSRSGAPASGISKNFTHTTLSPSCVDIYMQNPRMLTFGRMLERKFQGTDRFPASASDLLRRGAVSECELVGSPLSRNGARSASRARARRPPGGAAKSGRAAPLGRRSARTGPSSSTLPGLPHPASYLPK